MWRGAGTCGEVAQQVGDRLNHFKKPSYSTGGWLNTINTPKKELIEG